MAGFKLVELLQSKINKKVFSGLPVLVILFKLFINSSPNLFEKRRRVNLRNPFVKDSIEDLISVELAPVNQEFVSSWEIADVLTFSF